MVHNSGGRVLEASRNIPNGTYPSQLKLGLSKNIEKLMIQLIEKHFKYNFASKLIVEATQINLQIF